VYHTTGFTKDQIIDLCVLVHASGKETQPTPGPPILGLFTSIVVTLTYARRNRVQAEIAEAFGVSQPTISRAVTAVTPLLGQAPADHVPVAEDLDPRTRYIVDGTLLAPCCRAGRGTVTASCTPGSTRPPG
jgi:Helix-turn-helix of DDE superfamily endonuclease